MAKAILIVSEVLTVAEVPVVPGVLVSEVWAGGIELGWRTGRPSSLAEPAYPVYTARWLAGRQWVLLTVEADHLRSDATSRQPYGTASSCRWLH